MFRTIVYAIVSLWLVTAIVRQPELAFQAALQGLTVWWTIVFPGLLPFLVLTELLLAYGAIHAFSTMLDPVMRRSAGVPGYAAWPLAIGWTAGYTSGAEATAQLRKRNVISRQDGQWLLAASYMPSPMFMFIVIGAGFLHYPAFGLIIALSVWLSALLCAALNRMLTGTRAAAYPSAETIPPSGSLLRRAALALLQARREDGRSFGKVLGDAVADGVQKLMMIGGFMIVCSLLAKLLQLSLPESWSLAAFSGWYESHLGAYSASLLQPAIGTPLTLATIAAVLSWGGWSGLLQIRSLISGTDLAFLPFITARIGHALLAFAVSLLLWVGYKNWFSSTQQPDSTAFARSPNDGNMTFSASPIRISELPSLWGQLPTALAILALVIVFMVVISCVAWYALRPHRSI